MTTTVVKTIGSGGDYSTLQAWEDACPADLTSVDQIWQGQCLNTGTFSTASGVLLTISGTTTDATRYIELTTQAGASFRDNAAVQSNALAWQSAIGVALSSSAGYALIISNSVNYTRISNLQIKCTNAQGRGVAMGVAGDAAGTCDVNNCIIEGSVAASSGSIAPLSMYGANQVVRNSVIVQHGAGQPCVARMSNGASAYNCTFVCPSDKTAATNVINLDAAASNTSAFKNCAFFGGTGVYTGFTPTFTTCYTDVASPPTGCTTATYANCFQNTANATADWRLKSGSPLIDVGTTDSTHAATDIAGTARPSGSAYDVGAWEYVAASGVTVSITGLRTTSAQGSLKGATTVAVTGLRATFAQGTVTPGIAGDKTVSVTGIRATFAAGVVDTVHLVAPTGIAITSAQGALTPNSTVAIAGFGMTSAQGAVTPQAPGDVTVAIGGLAMTATAGLVTGGTTVALTGVVVDMRAGTLTASGGDSHWLPVPRAHTVWTEG